MMASISDIMKVMLMFDSNATWDNLKPSPPLNTDVKQLTTILALSLFLHPSLTFLGQRDLGSTLLSCLSSPVGFGQKKKGVDGSEGSV
jgi:hypothetical protein